MILSTEVGATGPVAVQANHFIRLVIWLLLSCMIVALSTFFFKCKGNSAESCSGTRAVSFILCGSIHEITSCVQSINMPILRTHGHKNIFCCFRLTVCQAPLGVSTHSQTWTLTLPVQTAMHLMTVHLDSSFQAMQLHTKTYSLTPTCSL